MTAAPAEQPPTVVAALVGRRVEGARRAATFVACVAVIAAIASVDLVGRREYSFFVLYLLVVLAGALLLRAPEAYAVGLVATVAWGLVDVLVADDPSVTAALWNIVGRFVTFAAVVYLLMSLRTAVERATESERRSREFLATAAHQLRTPLAGLIASAEAMSVEQDPEVRDRLLGNLVAGTNRSRRLLSLLLEISRLDQASAVDRRIVDVTEVCRREVELTALANPALDVELEASDVPLRSPSGDALREALANLLDNGARHARTSLRVRVRPAAGRIVVEVRDDGAGLDPDDGERVFERFVSLDAKGGSGLGLSIARAAMVAVGGTVAHRDGAFVIWAPLAG